MRKHKSTRPVREKVALFAKDSPYALRWINQKKRNARWFQLHWHPEIEIHLITGGTGKYIINGKAYQVSRNSLIVIHPREVHKFVPPGNGYERVSLLLKPQWLGREGRLGRDFHHQKLTALEISRIIDLLQKIRMETEDKPPLWQDYVRARLKEFFILVRRAAMRPAASSLRISPLMNQLLAYLDENYMRPLSLPQMADHFGFSPFYLAHCFSIFTGMGIKHYILQRRIAEAQLIMEKQPNLKLTAVARQLGFKDYALFNRAFSKIVHVPPSACRK
ncbi:MAG: AraC family transcriptional regulator [Kiritimatiellia bacterium]